MSYDRVWIDRWLEAIHEDPACLHAGRDFDGAFTLAFGAKRFTFAVHRGRVETLTEDGGPLAQSSFTLLAETEVWNRLFDPDPAPMNHAIFAAIAAGRMQFEGDIRLVFQHMTTLGYWIAAARRLRGQGTVAPDPVWPESFQAVGRFVTVTVDDKRHKVFYLEAGEGTPVLLQHTAGNENRQWRHLLEDRELTRRFRFIAYDLPAHGKSDPPYGGDFWTEDHFLTSDWVTRFVVALADRLALDRPVFMGCSIGGVIAMHLAERYPERFRGLVSLAGAIPTYGFFHDWWIDPGVNIPLMTGGLIDAVMAPGISAWDRQINRCLQSAHPKSLRNDLYLWGVDNSDADRAARIDASKVPLYLYAGEYDFTCPPELVEQTARRIGPQVHYEMLAGLGHFPMSEDYTKFRPVLVRTLEEIQSRAGAA